jgi:hypothetical protein
MRLIDDGSECNLLNNPWLWPRKSGAAICALMSRWCPKTIFHIDEPGDIVFRHACKLGLEGIVSKRLGSPYRSGRSRHWVKSKNPKHPAVKREAEEDWGK